MIAGFGCSSAIPIVRTTPDYAACRSLKAGFRAVAPVAVPHNAACRSAEPPVFHLKLVLPLVYVAT